MEKSFSDAVIALGSVSSSDMLKQLNSLFLQIAGCDAENATAIWQTLEVVRLHFATEGDSIHRILVERMQEAAISRMVAISKELDHLSLSKRYRDSFLSVIGQRHHTRFL